MTTTVQTHGANAVQLEPYIFFNGRCEEALEFYKGVFGGSYELTRNSDMQIDGHDTSGRAEKIMHASFSAPGVSFMASDGRETKPVNPDEGNVSLSLGVTVAAEGDRLAAALAEGGTVEAPLGPVPWGGRFAAINDRFGVQWFITTP